MCYKLLFESEIFVKKEIDKVLKISEQRGICPGKIEKLKNLPNSLS
jgi:hypothetical protein